jgi:hypothetical protein
MQSIRDPNATMDQLTKHDEYEKGLLNILYSKNSPFNSQARLAYKDVNLLEA